MSNPQDPDQDEQALTAFETDADDEGDFADEHDETSTSAADGRRDGEPESPHGRSGLEATTRPS